MLFTFPSRYWFTIGLSGVFSLTGWSRLIHAEFLVLRATQDTTRTHMLACTGLSPSMEELSRSFHFAYFVHSVVLLPRCCRNSIGLGSSPFARHYLGNHCYFLFLQVLRCFSSLRSPPIYRMTCLQHVGLSHSEISASKVICTSTELIAAYHVLHRLREPRHPPCALSYFLSYLPYAS